MTDIPRPTDAKLTALLAAHTRYGDGSCMECVTPDESGPEIKPYGSVPWPCETVRLATEVRDLRRDAKWNVYVAFADWHPDFAAFKEGWDLVDKAWRPKGALAHYEEGAR